MADISNDRPNPNPWSIVLPMAGVFLLMVGFFWSTKFLGYCEIYPFLVFAYPLLFGTGGVILGGQISIQGKFIAPFPWAVSATAGVASALVGLLIAYNSQKPDCGGQPRYTMVITDIPSALSALPGRLAPEIVIPEYDRSITGVAVKGTGFKKDVTFTFDPSSRFTLALHILRLTDGKYEFYHTCTLTFETNAPPDRGEAHAITREGAAPRFSFDANYVQRLDETGRSGSQSTYKDNCLSARSLKEATSPQPISPPFYVDTTSGNGARVTFVREEPTKVASASGLNVPDIGEKTAGDEPAAGAAAGRTTTAKTETAAKTGGMNVAAAPAPLDPKLMAQLEARKTKNVASASNTVPTITPADLPKPVVPKSIEQKAIEPKTTVSSSPPRPSELKPPARTCIDTAPAADAVLIGRFIDGDDLDYATRKSIYAKWEDVHCRVISAFLDQSKPDSQRARALRLLTFGLANVEDRKWQPGGKSYRDFSEPLPLLTEHEQDYIFSLTQSDTDVLREQALLFVRTLPADAIEQRLTQAASTIDKVPQPYKERYAIAAVYLYYNRVAEFLNETPNNTTKERIRIRAEVGRYAANVTPWLKDTLFTNGNASSYRAMIAYVTALVEREKKLTPDAGRFNFARMLDELRRSSDGYPSRFIHIAQALAFTNPGQSQPIMDRVKKATEYPPAVFVDEKLLSSSSTELFAGPGSFASIKEHFPLNRNVRLLMQYEDWDLVLGNGQVGWMQRQATVAAAAK